MVQAGGGGVLAPSGAAAAAWTIIREPESAILEHHRPSLHCAPHPSEVLVANDVFRSWDGDGARAAAAAGFDIDSKL